MFRLTSPIEVEIRTTFGLAATEVVAECCAEPANAPERTAAPLALSAWITLPLTSRGACRPSRGTGTRSIVGVRGRPGSIGLKAPEPDRLRPERPVVKAVAAW